MWTLVVGHDQEDLDIKTKYKKIKFLSSYIYPLYLSWRHVCTTYAVSQTQHKNNCTNAISNYAGSFVSMEPPSSSSNPKLHDTRPANSMLICIYLHAHLQFTNPSRMPLITSGDPHRMGLGVVHVLVSMIGLDLPRGIL
jgi:hypothetical protein